MELSNENREVDLAEAQSHVWNHALRYIHSMTLKCAIQLGIPDIIDGHGRPMTLHELVSALSIHSDRSNFIQRLMRILVHSGFFALKKIGDTEGGQDEDEDKGYVLTLASTTLLKGNPLNISPMMIFLTDPILKDPFHNMSKWLYHDTVPTAFMDKNKQDFWEYVGQDQEKNRLTNEAMASDTHVVADALIDKCRATFERATSLVDVGGGTGGLTGVLAREFSHLDCTVFDLPHVVNGLKGNQHNLRFEAGDKFVAVPPSDLLILKWILHDWSDEKSIEILRRCREAITQNGKLGKVVIIDIVIQNNKEQTQTGFSETQLLFDMLMMVNFAGKERNEEEWASLFRNAGFSNYNIIPFIGFRSIIELFP